MSTARITIFDNAEAAVELAEELTIWDPPLAVIPNTSAAVGMLARWHNAEHEAVQLTETVHYNASAVISPSTRPPLFSPALTPQSSKHSVDLLVLGHVKHDDAEATIAHCLTANKRRRGTARGLSPPPKRPPVKTDDFSSEQSTGELFGTFNEKTHLIAFDIKPSGMEVLQSHVGSAGHGGQTISLPALLLFFLLDVFDGFEHRGDISGDPPVFPALSILYVFFLFVDHVHPGMNGPLAPFDWSHTSWLNHVDTPVRADRTHRPRYLQMCQMLDHGRISEVVLEGWAAWFVKQGREGYAERGRYNEDLITPAHEVVERMTRFVRLVTGMVIPARAIGVARKLGKTLPAGMTVFHPDSARRRTFEGRW